MRKHEKREIKMTKKLLVESEVFTDGTIEQTVFAEMEGIRERIRTEVINTKESQVRDCLIKLGWIPPAEGIAVNGLVVEIGDLEGAGGLSGMLIEKDDGSRVVITGLTHDQLDGMLYFNRVNLSITVDA
jgi:hypothetical protein